MNESRSENFESLYHREHKGLQVRQAHRDHGGALRRGVSFANRGDKLTG